MTRASCEPSARGGLRARGRARASLIALLATGVATAGLVRPAAAQTASYGTTLTPKQRAEEKRALTLFAAGRYAEAVDIYAALYAEHRDPIYLRNIGRCYQRLDQPDKAIAAFEEYLAKVKRITTLEEEEVSGYIRELRARRDGTKTAATPPLPAPAPEAAPAPPPPAPVAPPIAPAAPLATATDTLTRAPAPAPSPLRRVGQGGLIAAAGLAVAGGAFMWSSWSKFDGAKDGKCGAAENCDGAADSVESRALLSKVFFVGAAAVGVASGVLIYLHPVGASTTAAGSPSTGVAVTAAGRF